ncbi:hypothetical protein [Paenibacillus senegalensis]|uniref:hypothetical protein n=1 Tax=Paenibacillus senegalensis TaxID=1465766 RepID=UPI00028850AA|nr:hypothetical protein [Paenibacillus senegalensis]
MAIEDPPKPQRQITYQIGWKKGKIDYNKRKRTSGSAAAAEPAAAEKQEQTGKDHARSELLDKSWTSSREASFSCVCGLLWLWSFPFAAGGLFIWLVYRLLTFNYGDWA